jgi:hypothetical protein
VGVDDLGRDGLDGGGIVERAPLGQGPRRRRRLRRLRLVADQGDRDDLLVDDGRQARHEDQQQQRAAVNQQRDRERPGAAAGAFGLAELHGEVFGRADGAAGGDQLQRGDDGMERTVLPALLPPSSEVELLTHEALLASPLCVRPAVTIVPIPKGTL